MGFLGVPENNYIVQATIPEKFESMPLSSGTNLQQHT